MATNKTPHAYEEKSNKKLLSQTFLQLSSISVLTSKPWGCEDSKQSQRSQNQLYSPVHLIIQSLSFLSSRGSAGHKMNQIKMAVHPKELEVFITVVSPPCPSLCTVWHHWLRLLRQPDWEKPAGRSEVFADAWGGPTRGSSALLHGGQRSLHPCCSGRGAGERRTVSHHIPGYG